MLPDLPDPHLVFSLGPAPARLVAGIGGLVLLVAGSRVYRLAVVLPGLLVGLAAGVLAGGALSLAPGAVAILAAVGALAGGLAAHLVERFAIVIAGVLGGLGGAHVAWPLLAGGAAPWWLWPAAAMAGAVVFPVLWKVALVPLTAWLGAVVLVDAIGVPVHPLVVPGVAIVGMFVQWAGGRKKDED